MVYRLRISTKMVSKIFTPFLEAHMKAIFFQNAYFKNPGSENNWIILDLEGVQSNRYAIGARVVINVIDIDGNFRTIYRKVTSGSSFGGNSLRLEVGLGKVKSIESCQIVWPFPNSYSNLKNLKINRAYKIVEGKEVTPFQYKSFEFPMKRTYAPPPGITFTFRIRK